MGTGPREPEFDGWPPSLPAIARSVPLAGGQIGKVTRATLANGAVVAVKQCPYPAALEADGFAALAEAGVPVPDVLGASGTLLVTAFVRGTPDWSALGSAIAGMHRVSSPRYGWHQDNRAGRFVQHNGWLDHWPTFFVERRITPHLSDPAIPRWLSLRLERACDGPIQALLRDRAAASLTHGDLWTGNIVDGRWLIDPEVSFADRELDLANMRASTHRPLPASFWDAYQERWPIDEGFESRRLALGLHHRLLQVRHFGESWLPAIDRDLTRLGW